MVDKTTRKLRTRAPLRKSAGAARRGADRALLSVAWPPWMHSCMGGAREHLRARILRNNMQQTHQQRGTCGRMRDMLFRCLMSYLLSSPPRQCIGCPAGFCFPGHCKGMPRRTLLPKPGFRQCLKEQRGGYNFLDCHRKPGFGARGPMMASSTVHVRNKTRLKCNRFLARV